MANNQILVQKNRYAINYGVSGRHFNTGIEKNTKGEVTSEVYLADIEVLFANSTIFIDYKADVIYEIIENKKDSILLQSGKHNKKVAKKDVKINKFFETEL